MRRDRSREQSQQMPPVPAPHVLDATGARRAAAAPERRTSLVATDASARPRRRRGTPPPAR
jgi:hypothetical protein